MIYVKVFHYYFINLLMLWGSYGLYVFLQELILYAKKNRLFVDWESILEISPLSVLE